MNYNFEPCDHIADYLKAIEGRSEFVVKVSDDGYTVIDYTYTTSDMWPDPSKAKTDEDRRLFILRRDCRGLIFDTKTGKVISKPLHKFFNCNERPETLAANVDMTQDYVILEKLDGSMLRPVRPLDKRGPNDPIRFGTMMGWTPIAKPVDEFVEKSSHGYKQLVIDMEEADMTPIFEWCSRKQPIVIDYPVDKLVLTAIRHNVTGAYITYDELVAMGQTYDVPVVEALRKKTNDLQSFIKYVRGIKNMEGYVIRFASGHMVKFKGDEYCFIHNSKEIMSKEKDVVQFIMDDKVDDVLPSLDASERLCLENFEALFHRNIRAYANTVYERVDQVRDQYGSPKDFFMKYVKDPANNIPDDEESLYMRAYKNQDVVESIMGAIKLKMHSGPRVDSVRKFWGGVNWIEVRQLQASNTSLRVKLTKQWAKCVDLMRRFILVK